MLFNTLQFGLFFGLVFGLWTVLADRPRERFLLLIGSSLYFYAAWNTRYLLLLGGVAGWDFLLGLALNRTERPALRRAWMTLAVVGNLGVLGVWKYADFALDTLRPLAALAHLSWPDALHLVLPVGISFFTFQGLGYVTDVYRRKKPAVENFFEFFLALAFFPHLVAGPIVRPHELIPRLRSPQLLDEARFGRALLFFLRGLVKKSAADFLASTLVDRVFDLPSHYSTAEALGAIYGYALQIYGDFSGYTDMAIGVAMVLGIDLPQNFDHPYASPNLQAFWRRWHMSLSSWLRDYLYITLGGSRRGFWRTQLNLFLTMLLGGLWHGASWNFVIWGGIHGGMLVAERLWMEYRPPRLFQDARVRTVLGTIITFHIVATAWVFFRADSFEGAMELLGRVWRGWGGGAANLNPPVLAVLGLGFAIHLCPPRWRTVGELWLIQSPALVQGVTAMGCLYAARLLTGGSTQPFIYFQF